MKITFIFSCSGMFRVPGFIDRYFIGRPIMSGCDGATERISAFVDHLIQPIAQKQASYLKDTTVS